MTWESEFFLPKESVLKTESESTKKNNAEKKFVHCCECNMLISVVSTTIYEIENKHYCSGCYSRKIIALAVERDHLDLKMEKAPLQK